MHSIAGVQGEIEECELQLVGVGFDWLEDEGEWVSILNDGPTERCRSSVIPRTISGMPMISFLISLFRANASIRLLSAVPRSAPCTAFLSRAMLLGSSGKRLRNSSRLPSTALSRLLKSWAIPPVS